MASLTVQALLRLSPDGDVFLDVQAPLVFVKQNDGPARGLAHIRLEWDDTLHDTVGNSDTCRNGGSGVTEDCPPVGRVRHLGSLFDSSNDPDGGLPVTIQPEITGLAGGFGWLLTLDGGAPHTLRISDIEVMPNTPLLLSIAYPLGTSFQIKAKASTWCGENCDRSCEESFTPVSSVQEVRHSEGNSYHFDDETGLLTIRIIMYPTAYTGEPDWKLYTFDDKGRDGEYSLFRFERNGVLLPKKSYPDAMIEIVADCTQNGAYCQDGAPVTSAYDDVCSTSFEQVSYDKCCDGQNNCEDLGLLAPTMSPTASSAPTVHNLDLIENGDFDSDICPWAGNSCTLANVDGVLSVTNRGYTWSGPRLVVTDTLQVDTWYAFSADVKFPSADAANKLSVKMIVQYEDSSLSTNYKFVTENSAVPNNQWTTLSTTWKLDSSTLSSPDVKKYELYFETPPMNNLSPTHDFMVDNVSMVEQVTL